jgi:tetratricopeptide (TPR) repeat protein
MLADNLQRSARSAAYFNRMLELDDTPAEAALQVCAYYFQNGRYNHMTQAAEKAAKRFPKNAQLYFLWGLALSQNSSSTMRAIEVLERSVNLDSSNVDALNQLAILYSSAGNTAASDAAYQSVLRIDPDNALANNNYAYALSERNQELDRAQAMIEIALKAEPKNPSYLDTMGWILYKRGDYKQALEYILQAIENGEVSATVYEHLGDVYQKLGNNAEAEKFWREALRKDSHRQSAKERLFHDKTNK